ncbi:LPXTG cell wall anchor domain-containing protein [Mesobacillus foraminis]|uniref:LPXTG cell wall anchor domain-containing protein n=1 Tax=Mesobacillus foraminis TaxID=279826 RepID=UPI001BE9B5DE|nr:LPXTG cell wall anchor domain-containing protein [Mesobacillus foraminis]MBT2758064.1 LPXTG cell wall anchor domain-containing protein [Mesobacillus foraminis]
MKKFVASLFALAFMFTGFSSVNAAEDKDCGDFNGDKRAIAEFWHTNGYSASNDPHDLDRDNDNLPCEVSQDEYNDYVASLNEEDSQDAESGSDASTDEAITEEESDTVESVESNDDSGQASDDATSGSSEEGEELPHTATNSVPMMALGAMLLIGGSVLVFRKRQTN